MESIAYGFAFVVFWLFFLAGLVCLGVAIVYGVATVKRRFSYHGQFDGEGLAVTGIFTVVAVVLFIVAYFISGTVGYKDSIKAKYNRTVHFSSKEVRLEKKVRELSDLRQQLIAKQNEVRNLQSEYQNDIRALTSEIKSEQKKANIQSYYQAKQHPRISYDLSLIQRKQAYITKLKETQVKLEHGAYELEFLERQSIDDLKMVKALGNEQVEALVGNINTVIAKYLPEAGKLAIEVDPNSMQTPEQIWQQINSGK
jgi:hypothetical protein